MQVQANDVIEKLTARLAQLIKENVIMEAHLESVAVQLDEKSKENDSLKARLDDLTKKLEVATSTHNTVVDPPTQ